MGLGASAGYSRAIHITWRRDLRYVDASGMSRYYIPVTSANEVPEDYRKHTGREYTRIPTARETYSKYSQSGVDG